MASLPRPLMVPPPRAARVGLLALVLGAGLPLSARALNGNLGFRQSVQDGGTGTEDYSLETIVREAYAQQLVGLWPGLSLRLEAQLRDEATQSRVGATSSNWDQLSQRASSALRYAGPRLRMELSGSGRRREQRPDAGASLRQDTGQLGTWGQLRAARWLGLKGSILETRSWREESAVHEVETRESLRAGGVESTLGTSSLRYGYSRQAEENLGRGSLAVNSSHLVAYEGGFGLQGGRGQLALSARTRHFSQRISQSAQVGRVLLEPIAAGVRIDASPEAEDPLENPLLAVPGLIDLDRRSDAGVAVGDDAPVGLQLGGDYRNIQIDLGAPTPVAALLLYVDRRPTAPALMQWGVWVAEDPEGRLWRRDETASASATYREWEEGLQGWEFLLVGGVTGRHFKLVNVKLGPVGDELNVTEIEPYAEESLSAGERRESSLGHRAQVGLDYRLSAHWRTRADVGLRLREHAAPRPDQNELTSGLGLFWAHGDWNAAGRLELRRLDADDRRDSDVATRSLSLRRRLAGLHSLGLGFEQTADHGRSADRLSTSLSLSSDWQLAPAFRIDQRLSHGWLRDEGADLRSRALTAYTALACAPFPWLLLDFSRADRWVEREAGLGYSRFNDTTLAVALVPVPLISLRSHAVYQGRERGEWLVTHSLSWTPLPGGDLALSLNASQFSDTRVDSRQAGAGVVLTWRPRPRLVLEGSLDTQRLRRPEGDSTPVNSYLRASLAF